MGPFCDIRLPIDILRFTSEKQTRMSRWCNFSDRRFSWHNPRCCRKPSSGCHATLLWFSRKEFFLRTSDFFFFFFGLFHHCLPIVLYQCSYVVVLAIYETFASHHITSIFLPFSPFWFILYIFFSWAFFAIWNITAVLGHLMTEIGMGVFEEEPESSLFAIVSSIATHSICRRWLLAWGRGHWVVAPREEARPRYSRIR